MAKYEVPGMKLISQDKTMSCWYASRSNDHLLADGPLPTVVHGSDSS